MTSTPTIDGRVPRVSVLMLAYNHGPYIRQALDSILMQKVKFAYEIVIGEDCSKDHTRQIINECALCHPGIIRLLANSSNLGMIPNFVRTLGACRGQYVAMLEGDDYWTDPDKLQMQVDALDAHPEWAICFHKVRAVREGETATAFEMPHISQRKPVCSLDDLMTGCLMATCSCVFRNHLFEKYPDEFMGLPMGDWPLHVLNARTGDIGYIDRDMGVYRLHSGGIWTSVGYAKQHANNLKCYDTLAAFLGEPWRSKLKHNAAIWCGFKAREYLNAGDRPLARKLFKEFIYRGGWKLSGLRRLIPWLVFQLYLRPILAGGKKTI